MKAQRIALVSVIGIVAICSLLLLFACDQKSGAENQSGSAASEGAAVDTVWQAKISLEADDFQYYVDEARSAAFLASYFTPEDDQLITIEENIASGYYSATFSEGNDSYRAGDYLNAEDSYNAVLAGLPTHFGVNNNLTLVLLQQQRNDEALIQALKTVYLYPKEIGCFLNVQVAADACGFHPNVTEEQLTAMLWNEFGEPSVQEQLASEPALIEDGIGYVNPAYNYNFMCAVIDFEIDPLDDIASRYEALRDETTSLSLYLDGDPDAAALLNYLDAAARLNGLEVPNSGS